MSEAYTTIMSFLIWGVGIVVYLYYRTQKKKESKNKINELWRRFAQSKDLTEEKLDESLYWHGIFKNFNFKAQIKEMRSNNSIVLKKPSRGNLVFRGQNRGFSCTLEMIAFSEVEGSQTLFTRFSIEVPSIPKDLILRPKTLADLSIGRLFSRRDKTSYLELFDKGFLVKGESTNEIKTFLTDDRKKAMVDFSKNHTELYIQDGKLFFLRKGIIDNTSELNQFYIDVGDFGWSFSKG